MNSHNPFDACQPWGGSHCGNQSNDPLVDKLIGNAYHVVRTVYCNLGNLKLIYDFLQQYGMVLGVQSEEELKALTVSASYARIYDKTSAGDRQVTDYLYVEGDRTGIIPDDTTATGSWIKVATSGTGGGGESTSDGGYIPWIYNSGSANGGETTIRIPDGTAGAPFMIVNGDWQTEGYDFTYDPVAFEIKFITPLEQGDFVVVMRTGVPANPDNPNISDWVTINWLYNNGAAVGGEQVIDIPYTFQSVPAVFKNGLRFYKELPNESYTIDSSNNRIILTEPLATNDRLIVQLGGEANVLEVVDHTTQEVARSANTMDSEVIISTNTTQVLNDKKVIFDVLTQRAYGLPVLPPNVYIESVVGDQLTYRPGNVVVTLTYLPNSYLWFKDDLAGPNGSTLVKHKLSAVGTVVRDVATRLNDYISVKDFGAKGDGVTDDTSSILAAISAAGEKQLYFPYGTYMVNRDIVITAPCNILGGGSRIKLISGAHPAVIRVKRTDSSGNGWGYKNNISDLILDGAGYAEDGLLLEGVISSVFRSIRTTNVTKYGKHLAWAQLCLFDNYECSDNIEAFTTTPISGIYADGKSSSANIFNNICVEKVTGSGIAGPGLINSLFFNGTSEGNGRYGIEWGDDGTSGLQTISNSVYGMDLEVNTLGDILLNKTAVCNGFYDLKAGYSSPAVQINGGKHNLFMGGTTGGFNFDAESENNRVIKVNLLGATAGFVDVGINNSAEDLYNISTAQYVFGTRQYLRREYSIADTPTTLTVTGMNIYNVISIATSGAVVIGNPGKNIDAAELVFTIHNLSGGDTPSLTFGSKYKMPTFEPPKQGWAKSYTFRYDKNFDAWFMVSSTEEMPN